LFRPTGLSGLMEADLAIDLGRWDAAHVDLGTNF
jgi:hypothetical protein